MQKSKTIATLLCFFLGVLGVQKFYTEKNETGVIQFLTMGGFVIWATIYFITILTGFLLDANGKKLK